MQRGLGSIDQGVIKLSEATKKVEDQSLALSASIKSVDHDATGLKGTAQKLDTGTNALISSVQAMTDGSRKVQGATENLQTSSTSYSQTVDTFRNTTITALSQLQKIISDSEITIRKFASNLDLFANNTETMGKNLAQMKPQLSSLEAFAKDTKSVMENLNLSAGVLPNTLKSLDTTGKELADRVTRLQGGLDTYLQVVEAFKRETNAIHDTSGSAASLTASMSGQYKNLEALLKDLEGLKTTLNELTKSLSQASSGASSNVSASPTTNSQPVAVHETENVSAAPGQSKTSSPKKSQ